MYKPVVDGQIVALDVENKTFRDKVKGTEQSYSIRCMDLIALAPAKGVLRVRIFGDDALPACVSEGSKVRVLLSKFEVVQNTPQSSCNPQDISAITK